MHCCFSEKQSRKGKEESVERGNETALFSIECVFDKQREKRRTYYRVTYLKSDNWKRKRALVLKRDRYRCVCCGGLATQVHHKQYARRNIGREPIEWLVSVCKSCHDRQHK
jgi:5-methylcytosine-specific restriction endonuclease McrA